MSIEAPICPAYTKGQTIAVTSVSSATAVMAGSKQLCLTNLGSNTCYVRVASAAAAASAADMPVLPGSQVVISKFPDHGFINCVTSAGTTSLHVIPGEGW